MSYIAMAYIAMAYVAMAYIVMAYIVMAYTVTLRGPSNDAVAALKLQYWQPASRARCPKYPSRRPKK